MVGHGCVRKVRCRHCRNLLYTAPTHTPISHPCYIGIVLTEHFCGPDAAALVTGSLDRKTPSRGASVCEVGHVVMTPEVRD